MAVSKVGTASTVLSSTGITGAQTITATYGSGQNAAQGNLLIARVTAYALTSTTAISTPAGWTKVGEANQGGHRSAVYWCVRGASAQGQPQFGSTLTGSYGRMTCRMSEVTGQDPTTPIAASGSQTGITGTSVTVTASPNMTVAGGWAFDVWSIYFGTTQRTFTLTGGTGFTNDYSTGGSTYQSHGAGNDGSAAAGTGTIADAATLSRSPTNGAAFIIVVAPAPPPAVRGKGGRVPVTRIPPVSHLIGMRYPG